MKNISILGSTGSIGRQTLELVRKTKDAFCVRALSCGSQILLLAEQIEEFSPQRVSVSTKTDAKKLKEIIGSRQVDILWGDEGNQACAVFPGLDIVVAAMVGMRGIVPVLSAIEAGYDVALANKEVLVAGGQLVTTAAKKKKVALLPIDSEHSAIWQCIRGYREDQIQELILTASGGPFRGYSRDALQKVTLRDALRHPTWSMGPKITVDSATMMNKGLEIIEAVWLFSIPPERISVAVHPQSIIHSMVRLKDGSVIAQMGEPDMMLPIQVALCYPERGDPVCQPLDLFRDGFPPLTFSPCDTDVFSAVRLAKDVVKAGGSAPVVLNGANEEAVEAFLQEKIPFCRLIPLVEETLEKHMGQDYEISPDLRKIYEIDNWARNYIRRKIEKGDY